MQFRVKRTLVPSQEEVKEEFYQKMTQLDDVEDSRVDNSLNKDVVDESEEDEPPVSMYQLPRDRPLGMVMGRIRELKVSGNLSWVKSIVDPRLKGKFSRKQAETLIQIGLSCVNEDRSKRPTMASVVQTLMECEDETEI
ncbi:Receptor-like serine/threonine-protein kinase [Abeliophyllum distichum]|uniref:Receptor-like serine/threonine-protein kinase n=1 Tax=Abeliophyllum distichum TaxID=126358 RepID=A0ABD1PQD4_9LAMI